MRIEQFIENRRIHWDRLSAILDDIQKRGPRRLDNADVNELIHLYREVSADLARLRAQDASPVLVKKINRLVARAHGQIYRGSVRRSFGIIHFLLVEYPRLFRRHWKCTLASFLCALAFTLMAYHTVQHRPELVADILGGADTELQSDRTTSDIRDRFRQTSSPILSSMVTTNNIRVALLAFGLGVTFGVGTIYILIINGTMLGGFAGAYAASGIGSTFWITVMPHGALELSAIVIAGGAGLLTGYNMWCPGMRTRRRALREAAKESALLAVGLIPAFIIAGIIEGFITPSDVIPDAAKVTLGVSVAVAYWAYLLIGGRQYSPAAQTEQ